MYLLWGSYIVVQDQAIPLVALLRAGANGSAGDALGVRFHRALRGR